MEKLNLPIFNMLDGRQLERLATVRLLHQWQLQANAVDEANALVHGVIMEATECSYL